MANNGHTGLILPASFLEFQLGFYGVCCRYGAVHDFADFGLVQVSYDVCSNMLEHSSILLMRSLCRSAPNVWLQVSNILTLNAPNVDWTLGSDHPTIHSYEQGLSGTLP